jgi:hypothetical protein
VDFKQLIGNRFKKRDIRIKDNNSLTLNLSKFDNSKIDFDRLSIFFMSLLTLTALLLKFHLLFEISINQDEFHYLSFVYKHINGSLTNTLQSFHVHFFPWLNILGPNEVIQVIGARIVMYLFFLGTCIYIFLIGKYYLGATNALFSVLCYISFVFTVVNGASFRHDTIATFLFIFSLYHFLVNKESFIFNIVAGLAMSIALTVTIKSALHMTVFVAVVPIRFFFLRDFHKTIVPTFVFFLVFLFGSIIIYKLHLARIPSTGLAIMGHTISSTYSKFILLDQFFLQFRFFKSILEYNIFIWLFLATGIFFNTIDSVKRKNYPINIYLFAFLIPLLSIFFYRNAFPYFYVFIMPTVTIFCGYLLWRLTDIRKIKSRIICFALVVIVGGAVFKDFITYYSVFSERQTGVQHQTLDVIHKMFPDPVPYIDGCSMVSSYPKIGFFMSSAGMEEYLKNGTPIMKKLLHTKKPLFLLANVPHLNLHSDAPEESDTHLRIMTDDWQALKTYFIHHWGPIWVVGRRFEFKRNYESYKFSIAVPGVYTVEGDKSVMIDSKLIQAGDTIDLKTGTHTITNQETSGLIKLRWGDHLYRPSEKPMSIHSFIGPFL